MKACRVISKSCFQSNCFRYLAVRVGTASGAVELTP